MISDSHTILAETVLVLVAIHRANNPGCKKDCTREVIKALNFLLDPEL